MMKILFTGASSFTGFWFVQELTSQGHEVTATLRSDYTGIRKLRTDKLAGCRLADCRFGSSDFLGLLDENSFDVLCHHAAMVENYKSLNFDVAKAFINNTCNLPRVLETFKKNGGKKIVITGSVFEKDEGAGTKPLEAFLPYGLSKTFTSDYFKLMARRFNLPLQKFVIPNPFGPYEEERFTTWLVKNWAKKLCPVIKTPLYVRDNIPVSLLAKAYASFVENNSHKLNPSGCVSTQKDFTKRFANQMRNRLNLPCEYRLHNQTEFPEPKERYNTDKLDSKLLGWQEETFWEELALYYNERIL